MHRKNLLIFALLIAVASLFIYPRLITSKETVSISQVTADPGSYLGKLTVSGYVASVYADDGVFFLSDEAGCCQLPVVIPFTKEQQSGLQVNTLYSGELPTVGETLQVSGTLKKQGSSFYYEIDSVSRSGRIIIKKN
ncbi:MAG: hypothetical protein KGZ79_16535 [Dethiobacter sp.]|jgi:aspartyl/asparaginyl-tRNA synthetase|nr:hypothetical protein [Dethiobacter sp.]MBS4023998.1 hypothetical protein [Dethiobacter sp.]